MHNEIENKTEVIKKIEDKNKIPGIVLHSIYEYTNLENLISNFKQILILSIKKPGFSSQEFNEKSYELIDKINSMKIKMIYSLWDGGVKSKIINKFISEKVVSGSRF